MTGKELARAKAINKAVRNRHPEWSAKRVYARTAELLNKWPSRNLSYEHLLNGSPDSVLRNRCYDN